MKNTRLWTMGGVIGLMIVLQIFPVRLRSQVATGTIIGRVKDPSGAVVPGVNISIKSIATGAMRKTMTDSNGRYQVPALPPGAYDVEASAKGFATSVRSETVTVSATVNLGFTLTVGNVTQRVQVMGAAPQLNTTNASMGGLVGGTAVRQLPLNGRDWLQLVTLQPGVVGGIGQQTVSSSTNSRAARGNGESLVISGNRPTGNLYLVDGLVVNDQANASPGSGLGVNLGIDAIQEFRVLTNEYTAEYGRSTGGVVTAALRSGTNQFHGDVYEFLRNSAFDSRNFYDTTKPPYVQNQYGGSVGGPIRKNKTFIFGDYEELRQVQGLAHSSDTLSPAARQGILQCVSGVPACASGAATYTVPIASSVQPYLAFFPIANGPTTGDTAKYNFAGRLTGHEEYTVAKVDQTFSDRTTLSGNFQFDNTAEAQPDPYNLKVTGSPSRHYNSVVSLQHVFSPTFFNTALVGVSRSHVTDSLDTIALNPIAANTALGFIPGLPAGLITAPGLTGTLGGLGGSGADILNFTSFQGSDDATWIKGRNTFKFGTMVQRMRYNKNSLVGAPLGEFDFGSIADLLQGIPAQYTEDIPGLLDIRGLRQTYAGFYFQDGIAVRPNLHVNAGVRYEYVTPITEAFGRVAISDTLASPSRTGGNYFNTNTKDFAPRVGIAWDPTGSGKTSVRAGFGLYDVLPLPYILENRTNAAPLFEEGNIVAPALLPSAFPFGGGASLTLTSLRGAYLDQNPKRAYNQEWNFTIQRQLAGNTVLSVGYIGSRANHLPRSVDDANQVPLSLVTISPDGLLFPATGPIQRINPFYGRVAATFWQGWSTYNSLEVDFTKRFSRGIGLGASYTYSKSMDIGSNTFSDNESNNTSGSPYAFYTPIQKGPSDFNIANRFVLNYTWDVPTPSSFAGASRALLGGWQLGGIFTAETGPPFSVIMDVDRARTGDSRVRSSSGGQRPNYNNIPGCTPNAINPGNPSNYLKLQCFSFPALGQLGDLGRNTLTGPGLVDFDFSLFKNWPLWREKMNLQFRSEFFNVLNRPNFQMGKTFVLDGKGNVIPDAGVIPSPTLTPAREIQFALKLSW